MKTVSYTFTDNRVTRETRGHDGTVEPRRDVTDEFIQDGTRWRRRNPLAAKLHRP